MAETPRVNPGDQRGPLFRAAAPTHAKADEQEPEVKQDSPPTKPEPPPPLLPTQFGVLPTISHDAPGTAALEKLRMELEASKHHAEIAATNALHSQAAANHVMV